MEHDDPASVGDLFWAVARRMRHRSREALAPFDVAPSQMRALGTLVRHGPARSGALAKHLGIAPRSATEVVDALAARGLVRREADPDDRRATLVVVTDAGRELATSLRRARATEADRLFTGLDRHDRAELERLLRRLLAAQEAGDPATSPDSAAPPASGAR